MDNLEIISIIRKFKCLEGAAASVQIPIVNQESKKIGFLTPVDVHTASQHDVLEKLTKWRRMFMRYFLTQFVPTPERTGQWLRQVVLPSDDRLLFLICDVEGKPVGNFGICNVSSRQAELDNLIRGEKGGGPDFVFHAELALLRWIFFDLDIPWAVLHVFSNNHKTIALHRSVGFTATEEKSLTKHANGEDVTYLTDESSNTSVDFKYLKMELPRQEFLALHPHISGPAAP